MPPCSNDRASANPIDIEDYSLQHQPADSVRNATGQAADRASATPAEDVAINRCSLHNASAATKAQASASDYHVSTTSFQIDIPASVLARARRGDVGAVEQIYRAFERPAYTLALRMLGNADSARETVHDAMLRLLERIGQFRGEAPFWGWLRQIVVNEALMRMRRERAVVFEELPDDDAMPCVGPPPWALADTAQLERALARLPPLTRSVLWLYHVEEYTHQEIATMTGNSVSFSKSQVARGSRHLRALLEPHTPQQQQEVAPCLTTTTP